MKRYGASRFMYGWEKDRIIVRFEAYNRHVLFQVPLPSIDTMNVTNKGYTRKKTSNIQKAHESEIKRRYRALALIIKAKFEIVESGIMTFEEEFLSHIVLPDGSTVGNVIIHHVEDAYLTGNMPKMLGSGK